MEILILWMIGALFTVAWGVLFYLIKQYGSRILENSGSIHEITMEIKLMKSKILEEEKILKIIDEAVRTSVSQAFMTQRIKDLESERKQLLRECRDV